MSRHIPPAFETELAWGIYLAPIVLTGGAVALLIAWFVVQAVGVAQEPLIGPLMAVLGTFSLVLAGVWVWGARRARLTITEDELRILPPLGREQRVSLRRLASVDLRQLPMASAARAMFLADTDGGSVRIGVDGWQREPEMLRLIGEAAGRADASVSPEARVALEHRSFGSAEVHTGNRRRGRLG
jgi:hypothetical protein